MYWPLGAPRVYAANKIAKSPSADSIDGLEDSAKEDEDNSLLGLQVSRSGHLFATITANGLCIWQTYPVVVLASSTRSASSLESFGKNVSVLLRPDASIVVVQTARGYLVTYNVNVDQSGRVYQLRRQDEKARRASVNGRFSIEDEEAAGVRELHIQFRMVIKIDAGISKALALNEDLVVATEKPAAVQCIRWSSDGTSAQTRTELLHRLPWMMKKTNVIDIISDRAMSLFVWIASDGRAYAVQRISDTDADAGSAQRLFQGYGFHIPREQAMNATKAAVNARFSLIAVACVSGEIHVYTARDYAGNIPLSHKLLPPVSAPTSGPITFLTYSPDGCCLFVGYEHGWIIWSVYGKLGGSSFSSDRAVSQENDEQWLLGAQSGSWIGGGSEMLFTVPKDHRLWSLEMARSAVTGCFGPSNVSRMLLYTSSSLLVYNGQDSPTLQSASAEASSWYQAQVPAAYLANQGPLRLAVISPDGRYIAVSGRRGLAHYSMHSGRWKTFDDSNIENSFVIRGGMCWYQHILITAVETDRMFELRLYSRELGLNETSLVFVEVLPSPVIVMAQTGEDSLLIYTAENNLYHYIITPSSTSIQLVQVGQIGLHGIVRAPARVRAVTWYIPDHQLLDGDPSQDVVQAAVIFLVDAKLVLLKPAQDEQGSLKYDMHIVANNVEYFVFIRDQPSSLSKKESVEPNSAIEEQGTNSLRPETALQDSLWYFDGRRMQCWTDIQDILQGNSPDKPRDLPSPVSTITDFYPTSVGLRKGVLIGIDPDVVQRRGAQFAFFRFTIRTQLFLPPLLRQFLVAGDLPSALNLSYHYQQLPYFSHALEILLHNVLDDEVESQPAPTEALLPSVLSFLSSFPDYLDILVQCTRKTEVRSWRTLFAHLPPPQDLFEESLEKGLLKTAGGYLLILHTFEERDSSSEQCIRLLQRAKEVGDWELCKELARFLIALDQSGDRLRAALESLDIGPQIPNGTLPAMSLTLRETRTNGDDSHKKSSIHGNESARDSSDSKTLDTSEQSEEDFMDSEDYFRAETR